jgi:hypothetical protein
MKWVYEIRPVTVGLARFEVRKLRQAESFWETVVPFPWPPEHLGFFHTIEEARAAVNHHQLPAEEYPMRRAPNGNGNG